MGHFYLPDGKPFYQVPYADPKRGMRDANLGDARKVGAYPSVTAILDVPRKPQLENWKIEQNILAALTNPEITADMPIKEIMRIIKRDARKQAEEAAAIGTEIHDAIEAHFLGRIVPAKHRETVDAVVALLDEHCGDQDWEAEKWFASSLGYGGKIDLISPEWVIDFKTKPGNAEDHKMYDEQLMQLVAYHMGTYPESSGPWRLCANIIVSRDIPGSVQWWDWQENSHQDAHGDAWHKFKKLLEYWQLDKGYFPHLEAA